MTSAIGSRGTRRIVAVCLSTVTLLVVPSFVIANDLNWRVINLGAPAWAHAPGVVAIAGDYNGDGRMDIAFHRPGSTWQTVPVLLARGDGSWDAKNMRAPTWAHAPGVVAIPGDYNGDGQMDVAFHRPGSTWQTVPVLLSRGDGSWDAKNTQAPGWANAAGTVAIPGDFARNGRTDLTFHRPGSNWQTLPILLSTGDGSWTWTNNASGNKVHASGTIAVSGDFDGDGRPDLAFLRPGSDWAAIPVALARDGGRWVVDDKVVPSWVQSPGVRAISGTHNGNARTDIALHRPSSAWNTVPVLFSEAPRPRMVAVEAHIIGRATLVAHESGGNKLLKTVRLGDQVSETLPGDLSPQDRFRMEQQLSVTYTPAWVYQLTATSSIREVTVAGSGVSATFVDSACVSDTEGGSIGSTTAPCEPPTSGTSLYVHFQVSPGSVPGDRDVYVRTEQGQQTYGVLRIARAGRAELVAATYVPGGSAAAIPIDLPALRNGSPLVGELPPGALRATPIRLMFSGAGVGNMKFSAPRCLKSDSQRRLDDNRLEVTAVFAVPAEVAPGSSGLVATRSAFPSGRCAWVIYDPLLDPILSTSPVHAGTSLANFTFLSQPESFVNIIPAHLTIASVGDSYGAGEGAPHSYNPASGSAVWEDRQCHRSRYSRLTRGAQKLTEIPGVWMLYRNFACSGATIDVGFIGSYIGVPRPDGSLYSSPQNPQQEQLIEWLAAENPLRFDALLVSFGGNEAGFSTAIAKCVSPLVLDCSTDDETLAIIANGDSTALRGINNLADTFERFDQRVRNVSPYRVLLTEYPDPISYSPRDRCNRYIKYDDQFAILPQHVSWGALTNDHPLAKLGVGGRISNLSYQELTWLHDNFLNPVNAAVRQAADRSDRRARGWRFVSGHLEHSRDRGYCTRHKYIHTFVSSLAAQGDFFGSVHPTQEGYDVYGEIIAHALIQELQLPPRPDVRIINEYHSQSGFPEVMGDVFSDSPNLVPVVLADPTRFRLQLAPTAHQLTVRMRTQRRNRYTGAFLESAQSASAQKDASLQIRTEFFVDRTLNVCESLDYWWHVSHPGLDGVRVTETPRRTLIPALRSAGEDQHCPRS